MNGKELRFGHAGILYQNSFVMYDRQTESLWVHVTGKAEVGSMRGLQLQLIPSTVTTWAEWKAMHPRTLVLPGYRRGGFMGTYTGTKSPQRLGLSVLVQFKAKLYPFRQLQQHGVVNDSFRGEDLVVAYGQATNTATAWKRQVNGQVLTFAPAKRQDQDGHTLMQDAQTKSVWSGMTGTALEGPLQGQQLEQVTYHPILIARFHAFYPDGPVFE